MVDTHLIALFMLGALVLNVTPGPDMTFVLIQSAKRGVRAGLAAALGIGTGAIFHVIFAAFGLAALFTAYPLAFDIVRYAGAVYLITIAWQMFHNPPQLGLVTDRLTTAMAFRQGMLTNLLNPKVAMFFIAFLPQFVMQGAGSAWVQILFLGFAFIVSGTLVNCMVALSGGRLAIRLRAHPRYGRLIGWISGSVMVGLALKLTLPEQR